MNYNYGLIIIAIIANVYIIQQYEFKRTIINHNNPYDLIIQNFALSNINQQEMTIQLQAKKGMLIGGIFEINDTAVIKTNPDKTLSYIKAGNMQFSIRDRFAILQDEVGYQHNDILIEGDRFSYTNQPPILKGYNFNSSIENNQLQGDYFEYDINQEVFNASNIKMTVSNMWLRQP